MRRLAREFTRFRPDALGVSLDYLANIPEAIDLARTVRRADPRCFVLFGGHSVSFVAARSADLARPGSEQRPTRFTLARLSHLDLLVACAGVGWAGESRTMPPAAPGEVVEVNVLATLRLVRQVVPHRVEAGPGRVLIVGSPAGEVGVREEAVYSAAKARLGAFADALRYELHGTGVGVGLVLPGVVDTPFFERRGMPYRRSWPRPIRPERVADSVWAAVSGERDEVYVPRWLRLPVRLRGLAPALYRRLATAFG